MWPSRVQKLFLIAASLFLMPLSILCQGPEEEISLVLGPVSGTIRPLLGVNAGPLPAGEPGNADVTQAYRDVGVTMIRTHDYYGPLDMATMYPDQSKDPADPSSYDFAASDGTFQAIVDGGFEPYLRLGDSWNNGAGYPPASPRCPTNPANWARAAVEVVRHYDDASRWGGSRLRYVEIWNEPDNRQFWDCEKTRFFELYVLAAKALKPAFPGLMIGGPGFTPAGALAPQGRQFTQDFLDHVKGQQAPLDFFSWHMYSNSPGDYADAASYYRQQLDARGFTGTESHVTEWNTAVNPDTPGPAAMALRTGGEGAALVTAFWITLQEKGVNVSTLYRGNDSSPNLPTWYGIFYADGRPKRAALAFSLWSRIAAHPARLSLEGAGGLYALAGQDGTGEVALLLANVTAAPVGWRIAFSDGRPVTAAEGLQVSDASEDAVPFALAGGAAEIGPHTVQLVILRPALKARVTERAPLRSLAE